MQKTTKQDQKEVITLLSKQEKGKADKQKIMTLLENYKIQFEFSESLKRDATFLRSFLSHFPETKIRKLMIERIEAIVNG